MPTLVMYCVNKQNTTKLVTNSYFNVYCFFTTILATLNIPIRNAFIRHFGHLYKQILHLERLVKRHFVP